MISGEQNFPIETGPKMVVEGKIEGHQDGQTYLAQAACDGNLEGVRKYLEQGHDIDAQGQYKRTALAWAVATGQNNIALYLIKQGADLNITDADNRTPLFIATINKNYELIKALLFAGADRRIVCEFGEAETRGIAEAYADVHKDPLALEIFAQCLTPTHTPTLPRIEKSRQPMVRTQTTSSTLQNTFSPPTALNQAKADSVEQNIPEEGGDKSLLQATVDRNYDRMEELLNKGANMYNPFTLEPLIKVAIAPFEYAAEQDDARLLSFFIKHGLDLTELEKYPEAVNHALDFMNAPSNNVSTTTASTKNESQGWASYLLDAAIVILDTGSSSRHRSASAKKLDEQKHQEKNIDAIDELGHTALSLAIVQGKNPVAIKLLEKKANPNTCDNKGCTPLFLATCKRNYTIIDKLLSLSADMNNRGDNPVAPYEYAAQNGDAAALSIFLKYGLDISKLSNYLSVVNEAVKLAIQK